MMSKISTIAIILLATFMVSEFARTRLDKVERREKFERQAQIAAQRDEEEEDTKKSVEKVFKDRATSAADGAEANSGGAPVKALDSPGALVQEAAVQGSGFWAFWHWQQLFSFLGKVRQQLFPVPYEFDSSSSFYKILYHLRNASPTPAYPYTILKAACDSYAFSCEEAIQIANNCHPGGSSQDLWMDYVMLFAQGRNNTGCISDPANAKLFVDDFEYKWPNAPIALGQLKQALIDSDALKPAKAVGPTLVQLQTGLRTDEQMANLLRDMEAMQLNKAYASQWAGGFYEPGTQRVFESWLKHMRAHGEQFSGPQLVTLVKAIPRNPRTSQAVSTLLQYLEQYVTGVSCQEVKQIIRQIDTSATSEFWIAGLEALGPNIVDGQNKVDIVAFADLISSELYLSQSLAESLLFVRETEEVLGDVGLGLPSKNNPIFGVVKGNPVILVVDESTSMDALFTLGNDTFSRRSFCHSQLETVLEGLPDGIYFNVIQYSSSAVKIFEKAVPVSKANIDAAMESMGTTWRGDYTAGQDPLEMLQNIKVFALKFKHLKRSAKRNAKEALRLAYATAALPSERMRGALVTANNLPQIYFLTSGQPDGGEHQILDNIVEFDKGRNIPVHSIGFIMPADPVAKRFVKDLANKTGGFLRSIEQASL